MPNLLMNVYQFFLILLLGFLLAGCRAAAESTGPPPPAAEITATFTPHPVTGAAATAVTTVTPASPEHIVSRPETQLDPYTLALAMVAQAAASLPEGWRLDACYEAAPFCWDNGQQLFGGASLEIKALADYYPADAPLRQAAGLLPAPGAPWTADQETAVQQALIHFAETDLRALLARQTTDAPDCQVSERPIALAQMGPLPAVTFGYACLNGDGEMDSDVRWALAIDPQHVYRFVSIISPPDMARDLADYTAVFDALVANMPVADPVLHALSPLPPMVSYTAQSGDLPTDLTWTPPADLPPSPTLVDVLRQPAQTGPLTAVQAAALAQTYGFDSPLYVAARGGLSETEAAAAGLFVAFDGLRSLSLSGLPYSYSDAAHRQPVPDLPFAAAAPAAERFLQGQGWLPFPYDMAASDQGEGVLFLPSRDGILLPTPAYGVRVAADEQVSGMSIYPPPELAVVGRYPIMTAATAWQRLQVNPNRPGTFYQITPPADTAVSASFPTVYDNIPAPGEPGDFYTNIWAYRPLDGGGPPIIQSSDFFRIIGDEALLNDLAEQTEFVVRLSGTVGEAGPDLLALDVSEWEAVPDAGGVPTFFGVVQQEGDQTFLIDAANEAAYRLPGAPPELRPGDAVAVTGMPEQVDGLSQLAWQKITVYPPQPEAGPLPTFAPLRAIAVTSVRLVYTQLPAAAAGLADNLLIPAWRFVGAGDNGAQVTLWVTAILPEFLTTGP